MLFIAATVVVALLIFGDGRAENRYLYDLNLGGLLKDKVVTYSKLNDPVGVTAGVFQGDWGIFTSSFMSHSIYFISGRHAGSNELQYAQKISGGSDSIDLDGYFGHASYAEPSRLTYDDHCKYLFVGTRRSMKIRVMRMQHGDVKTCQSDGNDLSLGSPPQFTEFPGIDVQSVEGEALYVTNSLQLFKISTADGHNYCDDIITSAVVTEYGSLTRYMEVHGYGESARIYSVAPDSDRSCLYVAIGDGKNVILKIPMSSTAARDYASIFKFVGDESVTWSGDTSLQNPPVAINGFAQSSNDVKLAFPMHMQYDSQHNYLYWSECYPFAGEFLLGSLAIRRLSLITGACSISFVRMCEIVLLLCSHYIFSQCSMVFTLFI